MRLAAPESLALPLLHSSRPMDAERSSLAPRWLPTTNFTWVFVALAVVAALSLLLPIQPEDFWWNMALGRVTWQTGRLPTVDAFSFTQPGEPIFVHGWLPQVLFY